MFSNATTTATTNFSVQFGYLNKKFLFETFRLMANECNIRVVCRFRPLNESEEKSGSKVIVKFPNNETDDTVIFAGKAYVFDKVFRTDATQEKVYNATAKEIVEGKVDIDNLKIIKNNKKQLPQTLE